MHHYYKSPEPFDDMMMHPLEGLGYYCILYGPTVLFPVPLQAFLAYMAVMGVCGVLDHCGVVFHVTLAGWTFYDTRDHDAHHQLFSCNYAFPFNWMDRLHGTHKTLDDATRNKPLFAPTTTSS
jgi:sterol desaturase/sphingolipid hydroxylase (fatty acid hydroxylase superfamily)